MRDLTVPAKLKGEGGNEEEHCICGIFVGELFSQMSQMDRVVWYIGGFKLFSGNTEFEENKIIIIKKNEQEQEQETNLVVIGCRSFSR